SFSWAVKVRRRGRSDSSGDAADGAGTTVGLRDATVTASEVASIGFASMGMSVISFSALKSKFPGARCLTFIGTEGSPAWHEGSGLNVADRRRCLRVSDRVIVLLRPGNAGG